MTNEPLRYRIDSTKANQRIAEIRRAMLALPDWNREFLTRVGMAMIEEIRAHYAEVPSSTAANRLPTEYTGNLGDGFGLVVRAGTKLAYANIVNEWYYWRFVDAGRGPGAVPPELIAQWAEDRLGIPPGSPESRAIIHHIGAFGIEGTHLADEALGPGTPGRAMVDAIAEQAADELMSEMLTGGGRARPGFGGTVGALRKAGVG